MIKKILPIFEVLLATLFFYITTWDADTIPKPFRKLDFPGLFYKDVVYNNRTAFGFILGIIIVLIILRESKNPFKKLEHLAIKGLLDDFCNSIMTFNPEEDRITVFHIKHGYQIFFKRLYTCTIKFKNEHKEKDLLKYYVKNRPKLFRRYFVQLARNGNPFPDGTTSYHLVPKSELEVNSIVADAFLVRSKRDIKLPRVNETKLKNATSIETYTGNKENLRKYLKKGKVKNIQTLKTFHKLPLRILCEPIIIAENVIWGCIVYDSKNDSSLSPSLLMDFNEHSKEIGIIANSLNKAL